MSYRYKSKDGLCESSNVEFVATWNKIGDEFEERTRQWVENLREQGIKAAHPDDGWVDREKDIVYLRYPQFNDGVEVGDTIALGWGDKWRLIKVVEVIPCNFGTHRTRYKFEPIKEEKPKEEKRANWFMRLLFGE